MPCAFLTSWQPVPLMSRYSHKNDCLQETFWVPGESACFILCSCGAVLSQLQMQRLCSRGRILKFYLDCSTSRAAFLFLSSQPSPIDRMAQSHGRHSRHSPGFPACFINPISSPPCPLPGSPPYSRFPIDGHFYGCTDSSKRSDLLGKSVVQASCNLRIQERPCT